MRQTFQPRHALLIQASRGTGEMLHGRGTHPHLAHQDDDSVTSPSFQAHVSCGTYRYMEGKG